LKSGFSLVELMVSVALALLLGAVVARMLTALARATQYTLRQTAILDSGRRAFLNSGKLRGMVWATQEAASLVSLSTDTLPVVLPGPQTITYQILTHPSSSTLVQTQGFSNLRQAPDITTMTVTYYEIGANGLIFESTQAANAQLAEFSLLLKGKGKQKSYYLRSSGWMRNK